MNDAKLMEIAGLIRSALDNYGRDDCDNDLEKALSLLDSNNDNSDRHTGSK